MELISKVIKLLKPQKRDSLFYVSSEMYIYGPEELSQYLAYIIRGMLVHGRSSDFILQCILMPIVKDSQEDMTSSKNYRALAGGCLILKLVDLVILQLEGHKLEYDSLQFAYQKCSSTSMCTWLVTSVVDYFDRQGSPVYCASMDMSKAFDVLSWVELFDTLLRRRPKGIFLRLLMYTYCNQICKDGFSTTELEEILKYISIN